MLPKWRHTLNVLWTPAGSNVDMYVQWRYVAAIKLETTASDLPDYSPPVSTYGDVRLSARNYVDIGASYRVKNFTFRFGINNLFDKDPPIVGASEGGNAAFYENNTFPGIYDTTGRQLHVSVRADF